MIPKPSCATGTDLRIQELCTKISLSVKHDNECQKKTYTAFGALKVIN